MSIEIDRTSIKQHLKSCGSCRSHRIQEAKGLADRLRYSKVPANEIKERLAERFELEDGEISLVLS